MEQVVGEMPDWVPDESPDKSATADDAALDHPDSRIYEPRNPDSCTVRDPVRGSSADTTGRRVAQEIKSLVAAKADVHAVRKVRAGGGGVRRRRVGVCIVIF